MALGTIAPWLQLPDFISAAHAGASIGLQQRKAADDLALSRAKLEQDAIEAAGRLGLGYANNATDITKSANEKQVSEDKIAAEKELSKATLQLRSGRYSDLNQQADQRHQLGEERLDALGDNRGVVNQLHQDQLDSLNAHRAEVDALRGTRVTGGGAGSAHTQAAAKTFMVKVPIPADIESGTPASSVSLPNTHPAAKRYLKSIGMGETPPESVTGLLDPDTEIQGGETIPIPTAADSNAQAAAALQQHNPIYTGSKSDEPAYNTKGVYMGSPLQPAITDPSTLPPEELTKADKPVLTTGKKRFRFDPKTGKFDPVE